MDFKPKTYRIFSVLSILLEISVSAKSTRSFCQKLVWQKNSGGSYYILFLLMIKTTF